MKHAPKRQTFPYLCPCLFVQNIPKMHPKILQFQTLVSKKKAILKKLCTLYDLQSDLEDSIILTKLEFQAEETTDTEILLLEIELYTLYQDLNSLDKEIIQNKLELENTKMYLNHL